MSTEADNFFTKYKNNGKDLSKVINNVISNNKFDKYVNKNKLADESLIGFLKNTNYVTKDLTSYQQYLLDTGQATSTFTALTKKAGSILKSFGAALSSMAIMWGIGEAISSVVGVIDKAIVTNEEYLEQQKDIISKSEEIISSTSSEISVLENLSKKLKETNGNKTEMLALSEEINEILGVGSSSILERADAYDILNAKIERNIELDKQEKEKANIEKKEALENTINNAEISNSGFGSDLTFQNFRLTSADYDTKTIDEYFNDLLYRAKENDKIIDSVEEYSELWRQAAQKMQDDGNYLFLNDSDKNWLVYSVPSEEELKEYFDSILPNLYNYFEDEINSSSFFASGDIKTLSKICICKDMI